MATRSTSPQSFSVPWTVPPTLLCGTTKGAVHAGCVDQMVADRRCVCKSCEAWCRRFAIVEDHLYLAQQKWLKADTDAKDAKAELAHSLGKKDAVQQQHKNAVDDQRNKNDEHRRELEDCKREVASISAAKLKEVLQQNEAIRVEADKLKADKLKADKLKADKLKANYEKKLKQLEASYQEKLEQLEDCKREVTSISAAKLKEVLQQNEAIRVEADKLKADKLKADKLEASYQEKLEQLEASQIQSEQEKEKKWTRELEACQKALEKRNADVKAHYQKQLKKEEENFNAKLKEEQEKFNAKLKEEQEKFNANLKVEQEQFDIKLAANLEEAGRMKDTENETSELEDKLKKSMDFLKTMEARKLDAGGTKAFQEADATKNDVYRKELEDCRVKLKEAHEQAEAMRMELAQMKVASADELRGVQEQLEEAGDQCERDKEKIRVIEELEINKLKEDNNKLIEDNNKLKEDNNKLIEEKESLVISCGCLQRIKKEDYIISIVEDEHITVGRRTGRDAKKLDVAGERRDRRRRINSNYEAGSRLIKQLRNDIATTTNLLVQYHDLLHPKHTLFSTDGETPWLKITPKLFYNEATIEDIETMHQASIIIKAIFNDPFLKLDGVSKLARKRRKRETSRKDLLTQFPLTTYSHVPLTGKYDDILASMWYNRDNIEKGM